MLAQTRKPTARALVGLAALLLPLLLAAGACDTDTEVRLDDGGVDARVDATAILDASQEHDTGADAGVSYQPCPGGFSGLCATLKLPLDWSNPSGKTIDVFIDKVSESPRATGQIWLLQGGPGGSGADLVGLAQQIGQTREDLDVFILEHRGVGYSTRLSCSQESELPTPDAGVPDAATDSGADAGRPPFDAAGCVSELTAKWGADLARFDTTSAARDLAAVIERTRKPGQRSFVYGVSYGTYWAQRYLHVAPTQAAGVILDSIVPMDGQFLSQFDLQPDKVAQPLAELCKADPSCSAALGPDPWAKLQAIKAKFGTGHCAELGLTYADRAKFTPLLQLWSLRAYALAAYARFDRCTPADVTALRTMLSKLSVFAGGVASPLLYFNVAFAELWETPPPSRATLQARADQAVFPAGDLTDQLDIYQVWPKAPVDPLARKYPTTSVPILMMNGDLDMQTPIDTASLVKSHYTAPNQTFVTIPNANHAVVIQSPMRLGSASCGFEIMKSFLTDPKAPPNTACLGQLAPVSFGTDPESNFFFGTTSAWLGAPTAAGAGAPPQLRDVEWIARTRPRLWR